MTERQIEFTSDNYKLAGTFVTPDESKPLPAVLMLPGSGQTDRDDNAKKLAINVFPQVAEAMSSIGVASLRYDKRGVGESEGDYWRSDLDDRIADAGAAIEWLKAQDDVDSDNVYVLGHSEGALVATSLAAGRAAVAGAILLAGSAKTGEETLIWQGEQIVGSLTGFSKWLVDHLHIDAKKKQQQAIDKIKKSTKDTYKVQFIQRINAKWMRELLAYEPEQDLAKINVPVLAITGSKDIQVDPADLERMKQLVKGPFEAHCVPDVTHLLRADAGAPGIKTYKEQARRPVDERVINYIENWLKDKIKR
ncbi:MAG: alpha/beta fold hydrolase [Candidatus Nomurabacteria bacterium]|nr:MAG: alpha/beta fold hydrolase [Candidatus Nomurabacteria bacterium]